MLKPPKREKTDYEKIPKYDEWIEGTITEVQHNPKYERKFQGETKIGPAVRFKFALKGCSFPHYSRWTTFSYSGKSNLYTKYLSNLVEDAKPDMDFDIELLKDFKIKTMWAPDGDYDKLEMIRPLGEKLKVKQEKTDTIEKEDDVPF